MVQRWGRFLRGAGPLCDSDCSTRVWMTPVGSTIQLDAQTTSVVAAPPVVPAPGSLAAVAVSLRAVNLKWWRSPHRCKGLRLSTGSQ